MFSSLAHSLDTQSSRYIVFLFLSGDIKSIFLIYLKKFSFCCLIFWNINDDYTESKKFFMLDFLPLSLPLPSHILPHFINVYVFAEIFQPYVREAKRQARTFFTQTQEKFE
jgi:hypothetical protein